MRRELVIVPIVEGHGEVPAVPLLIQGWLRHRRFHVGTTVAGPVRAPGAGALKTAHQHDDDLGIEHYIQLALLRRPDAIIVILDADGECPGVLGPALLDRARSEVPLGFPIGVVLANREYEVWFLAAFSSGGFRQSLRRLGFQAIDFDPSDQDVEQIADCKARLEQLLGGSVSYEETIHQAMLTRILPFNSAMLQISRSFRKLNHELEALMRQARRRRRAP